MIHVAYGLHDKTGHYSKFVGTSMLSLFENHSSPPRSVTVHLLHDNTLTLDSYEKFVYLAGQYNQIIKFYNVERNFPEDIDKLRNSFTPDSMRHFSVAVTFRLLMGKIIPDVIVKIIHIDADIIVNLDINELWQVDIGDKILAVVPEFDDPSKCANFGLVTDGFVKPENYFNAGVMVMNLEKWRNEEEKIMDGVKFVTEKKYPFMEQEALNYCYSEEALHLPRKFNVHVREQPRFSDTPIERKLYHYLGRDGSLGLDMRDKFNRLWFSYFEKTPFFNKSTVENLYNGVRELYVGRQNLMTQISAMVSGKSRAFVTFPQNIDALKKIFYVQESEEIFQIDSPNWGDKLINEMRNSVGKKIYFMMIGGIYPQLRAGLMQMGFVEGRDFLNAEMFLSEVHGVQLNSYPLIEKM